MAQVREFRVGDLVAVFRIPKVLEIGKILGGAAGSYKVKFFTDKVQNMPVEELTLFSEYLSSPGRKRRFSRSRLCRAFFAQDLLHLTTQRKRVMQSALRKSGVWFSEEGWDSPKESIQLWEDPSVVLGGPRRRDIEFEKAMPRWLEPPQLVSSSRDPLGLQAFAESLANEMLPGLTVFTSRVGYYGFLCWALKQAASWPESMNTKRDYINRLERAFVLSEFVYHGAEDRSCSLLGQRNKLRLLRNKGEEKFLVPDRILKNQNSSGALRLYSTSLVSMGLAADSFEAMETSGFPLALTPSGDRLAAAFSSLVPPGFIDFAQDNRQTRDGLRRWGKRLCFSSIARDRGGKLRRLFMKGFLFEGGDAETRYKTVRMVLNEKLWPLVNEGSQRLTTALPTAVSEEEEGSADALVDVTPPTFLGNDDVLLHFYRKGPSAKYSQFQLTAIYEFIAVGMNAIFAALLADLEQREETTAQGLLQHIVQSGPQGEQWRTQTHEIPPVRKLWMSMRTESTPYQKAALGGLLIQASVHGPHSAMANAELLPRPSCPLNQMIPRSLLDNSSMASCFPELLDLLVQRHLEVSDGKGRQRWCFPDGDTIRKDDARPMGIGLHSMRFPQVSSLMNDLKIDLEELLRGL